MGTWAIPGGQRRRSKRISGAVSAKPSAGTGSQSDPGCASAANSSLPGVPATIASTAPATAAQNGRTPAVQGATSVAAATLQL